MADCTKTSIGETASTYARSGAHQTAGLAAAAEVAPISGKIGLMFIGMSNQDQVSTRVRQLYLTDPDRNTNVVVVRGGKGGHTAKQWSDPTHSIWPWLEDRVTGQGLVAAQIQIVHMMMTNAYPLENGAMTEAQVDAIVNEVVTRYPNVKLFYMSGINYTGYANDTALSPSDRDRVPEPHAYNDSLLLASLVGTHAVWTDFFDLWANGTTANARTNQVGALTADCDPLAYDCADVETDGVHPSTTGEEKEAVSLLERWRVDPVAHPLWIYEVEDPPAPPPVYRGLVF